MNREVSAFWRVKTTRICVFVEDDFVEEDEE